MLYLAQQDDRLYIVSNAHKTGFDTIVEVDSTTVKLTRASRGPGLR